MNENYPFCPRYLEQDITKQVTQVKGDETVTVIENKYIKLKCDANCALYEFRPQCIFGG